jgi:hypothetical protein
MFLHSPTSLRALPKPSSLESAHTPPARALLRAQLRVVPRARAQPRRPRRAHLRSLLADVGRSRFRRPTPSEIDAFCERLLGRSGPPTSSAASKEIASGSSSRNPTPTGSGSGGAHPRPRGVLRTVLRRPGLRLPRAQAVSRVRRNGNAVGHPRHRGRNANSLADAGPLDAAVAPVPRWKRALDVAAAGSLLLLLLPLFVLVAVAIGSSRRARSSSGRSAVGRGGRLFDFYKFRSMHADAEARKGRARGAERAGGSDLQDARGSAHHAHRALDPSSEHRRAASALERAQGRFLARRPAACRRQTKCAATSCGSGGGSPSRAG